MDGARLRAELHQNNLSAATASALLVPPITMRKLSQQQLSAIMNGQRDFDSPAEARSFFDGLQFIRSVQESVTPQLPVDWANVLAVRDTLIRLYEERQEQVNPTHKRCYFVRLSVTSFFKEVADGNIVSTPRYVTEAAAFVDFDLANQVRQELKKRGVESKVELLTALRGQRDVIVSLGSWFRCSGSGSPGGSERGNT
jgi:hypothetical protein